MNLMSLFNFKYLMQNIKKSKGLVILLILLVPMFTSIMLLSANGDEYALSFSEVSMVNIIGMYIIPIVLSMTLFSYVYKKNSVDFIGSMPISRKTIFITNTIGGIAIIALMQLITLICTIFLSRVLSNIIIFGSMVWDIFVCYTISYIFVFVASNMVISFSGNKFSGLVGIFLIIFLIPFIVLSGDAFGDNYSYINVAESLNYAIDNTSQRISIEEHYNFTMPSQIFDMIATDANYEYSTASVIKMFLLSIIYTIIGLILFKHKKMEMAGESYENIYIHLIIKMLTFVPFMFVYCSLSSDDRKSIFLFFIAILAVYYFIFDLITNKKVRAKISIPAFIISTLFVFAIYEGIIPKFGRNNLKIIKMDDIQSVTIESINNTYRHKNKFGLLVEDKDLINLILRTESYEKYDAEYYSSKGISENEIYTVTVEHVPAPSSNIAVAEDIKEKFYQGSNAEVIIKLNNGREYIYNNYLDARVYEKVIEKIGYEKVKIDFKDALPLLEGMRLEDKERKEIIDILSKELGNLSYKELYSIYNSQGTEYTLALYRYENHKLIRNNISFKSFMNLYQYMAEICNKFTVDVIYDINSFNLYSRDDVYEIVKKYKAELFSGDQMTDDKYEKLIEEFRYSIFDYAKDDVIHFIIEDSKNKINVNEKYSVIRSYYPTFYYTNNLEGLGRVIADSCSAFIEEQIKYYEEY